MIPQKLLVPTSLIDIPREHQEGYVFGTTDAVVDGEEFDTDTVRRGQRDQVVRFSRHSSLPCTFSLYVDLAHWRSALFDVYHPQCESLANLGCQERCVGYEEHCFCATNAKTFRNQCEMACMRKVEMAVINWLHFGKCEQGKLLRTPFGFLPK